MLYSARDLQLDFIAGLTAQQALAEWRIGAEHENFPLQGLHLDGCAVRAEEQPLFPAIFVSQQHQRGEADAQGCIERA